jgi:hypothetical protein
MNAWIEPFAVLQSAERALLGGERAAGESAPAQQARDLLHRARRQVRAVLARRE